MYFANRELFRDLKSYSMAYFNQDTDFIKECFKKKLMNKVLLQFTAQFVLENYNQSIHVAF